MLESILNFGGTASVDINIDPNVRKKTALFFDKARNKIKLPVYTGDDDISGVVEVKLQGTKRLEHLGIRIELVGHLEMYTDKALSTDFMSMAKELEPAGALVDNKVYRFMFPKFEKAYETFYGSSGSVRYYLRVSITRNYNTRIVKEVDFAVQLPTPQLEEEGRTPIKLEVGIEECLLIDFEYNKSNYHLKDCIVGKVSFHLVRIKIKLMEIAIVRREIIGTGPSSTTENETLVRFQAMDGCPAKGEVVPIRLYLSGVELTPSYKNVNNRLAVKHFINLILVDEEERRYFKQHEITIYRKK